MVRRLSLPLLLLASTDCSCDLNLPNGPGEECTVDEDCGYVLFGGFELECHLGTCREIPGQCYRDEECPHSGNRCTRAICRRDGIGSTTGTCDTVDTADGGLCLSDGGLEDFSDSGPFNAPEDGGLADSGDPDVGLADSGAEDATEPDTP